MKILKPYEGKRRDFSPEAYGEFPIVPECEIANLRKQMVKEMENEEWEVLEDVFDN